MGSHQNGKIGWGTWRGESKRGNTQMETGGDCYLKGGDNDGTLSKSLSESAVTGRTDHDLWGQNP